MLIFAAVNFGVQCCRMESPKPGSFSDMLCFFNCFRPVEGFFYDCTFLRMIETIPTLLIKTND
ncbi:hypothetical protein SAMN05660226_03175 [Parapedobacter luteus]|uniref:Uncharacterized protein n=1 Tax=Parapedobacter luteus TaxID=623280 RepID=A0A1T5E5M3_9SPHI|nr:hypothetical protein SAMN05660226_03175 [Parapedobacter luteus]